MSGAIPVGAIGILGWARIAMRLAAMVALLLACVPLYYLWRPFPAPNPWPRRFLGAIARIAGARVRHRGLPMRQGALLIANHVSWIDVPALAGATGCAFVAHDGLASVPLLRWLCAMNDTVFVARHDRRSVAAQVAQVRAALDDTGALAIFPEGTTSDGTGVLAFKSSLLSAFDPPPGGISVQPVVLDYGSEAAAIAWVGTEHGLANFMRILGRHRPVILDVRFLEPLAGDALAGRKAMAAAASAAIAGALAASRPMPAPAQPG
jgi:1-acyl-sn-glycerol-3-phosphate acyltransferase